MERQGHKMLKKYLSTLLIASSILLSTFANSGIITTDDYITYDWSATCYDCNSAMGEYGEGVTVFGSMVLKNYILGNSFVDDNIVSFSYNGPSLHIDSFQVNNFNQGLDDIYNISGLIREDLTFEIEFHFDHIFTYYHPTDINHTQPFQDQYNVFVDYNLDGNWAFTVDGPRFPEQAPADFGSRATLSAINVPEPSTLAIFALSIIGLASRNFKKNI
jgi:hypothetical protein